jgi:hypothetical protein
VKECLGCFKVTLGTGIKAPAPCHCPYCGHSGEQNTFYTQEQIDYAHSVLMRKLTDALVKNLKSLEFEHKPRGPFGIGISMKMQPSAPHPIRVTPFTAFLDGAPTDRGFLHRLREPIDDYFSGRALLKTSGPKGARPGG